MADDPVHDRFARSADRVAAKQDERAAALADEVRRFALPSGDERALDVGTGAGALAFALAPLVREVVGADVVPELLDLARERAAAFGNVSFVEADATALPFERASFDLGATLRTLHHVPRPELVVAELSRVTRPGGRLLVIDQIAPNDPLAALELDRFERARDPSHTRLLPDVDLRSLFDANSLVLLRSETHEEERELEAYLDLAACDGEGREQARALAPDAGRLTATLGWYLLRRA
jgi:ubiquinone/menaquinone biosynthesis C-methylase UbiE